MTNKELFRYEVECSEPPLEKMDFTEELEQSGTNTIMIYEDGIKIYEYMSCFLVK
jgi:hypothetical protein